jgi:hypothetical protein
MTTPKTTHAIASIATAMRQSTMSVWRAEHYRGNL